MLFVPFFHARRFALACSVVLCCQFSGLGGAFAETPAAQTDQSAPSEAVPVEAVPADPVSALPPAPGESAPQKEPQPATANAASTSPAAAPDFPRPDLKNSAEKSAVEPPAEDSAPDSTPAPQPIAAPVYGESLRSIVDRKHLALPLKDARIVIDKSQRRLDLLSGNALVKSYRVSLGKNPVGAKKTQGDSRTPEGHFYICTRNASTSAFHIFLGLSYPALPDAKRAVSNKQITWREYQIINQRLASRGRPPWETNLGGWVGIHGGTDDGFAQKQMATRGSRDWTAGCIALTNREIEELYAATRLGTPVEVKP